MNKPITIEEITENESRDLITKHPNVVIVHSKDGCPVCEYFIPEILEPIFKDYANVKVKMIKEPLTFPVGAHPITYFFKDGKCLMHPSGSAAEKAVRDMMDKLYGKPI